MMVAIALGLVPTVQPEKSPGLEVAIGHQIGRRRLLIGQVDGDAE